MVLTSSDSHHMQHSQCWSNSICCHCLNPLTSRSDQHVTSLYDIHTLSSKQVVRLFKLIRNKVLSWLNTKFLQPIYKEMCSIKRRELTIRSWVLKGWLLCIASYQSHLKGISSRHRISLEKDFFELIILSLITLFSWF